MILFWLSAQVGAVTEATVAGEKYSAFTLAVGDRGEVTVTGVNALGGASGGAVVDEARRPYVSAGAAAQTHDPQRGFGMFTSESSGATSMRCG